MNKYGCPHYIYNYILYMDTVLFKILTYTNRAFDLRTVEAPHGTSGQCSGCMSCDLSDFAIVCHLTCKWHLSHEETWGQRWFPHCRSRLGVHQTAVTSECETSSHRHSQIPSQKINGPGKKEKGKNKGQFKFTNAIKKLRLWSTVLHQVHITIIVAPAVGSWKLDTFGFPI